MQVRETSTDHDYQLDTTTTRTTTSSTNASIGTSTRDLFDEKTQKTKNKGHKVNSSSSGIIHFWTRCIEFVKYAYSCALLLFSIIVVMGAILSKQTVGTAERGIPPILAVVVFWFFIVYLATMEGGQGCLVGLQLVEPALYATTHPITLLNTQVAHRGDNTERFIVGRQFLTVLVIFVSNIMSSAINKASIFGLPDLVNEIFLESGVALILVTITLGQLTSQVNAADCMLDFINNYFMLYMVTYVSLGIEYSGILHVVYLVRIIFAYWTDQTVDSSEEPRDTTQSIFFWARVLVSVGLLIFAFIVTLTALFDGKTTMWDVVPPGASVILFFGLMCFVGLMEGMQIALFGVVNMPEEELREYSIAQKTCELAFEGKNLQAFLIGRQILVTICMFVVARISTLNYDEDDEDSDNVLGVSDPVQDFFNTGLLGALITTIVASLAWRIIASSSPLIFLSNPLIYLIIRLCLLFEASGLCSSAWLLASLQRTLLGYQPDTKYLGDPAPEEQSMDTSESVRRMSVRLLSTSSGTNTTSSSRNNSMATAAAIVQAEMGNSLTGVGTRSSVTAADAAQLLEQMNTTTRRRSIFRLSKNLGSSGYSFGS